MLLLLSCLLFFTFTIHRVTSSSLSSLVISLSLASANTKFLVDLVAYTCIHGRYQVCEQYSMWACSCLYCQAAEGTTQLYSRNFQPTEVPTNLQPGRSTRRYSRVRSVFVLPSSHITPSPWLTEGAMDTKGRETARKVSATSGWGHRGYC